jgi:ribosomal protein S12 methylthiotransferase accessory factor
MQIDIRFLENLKLEAKFDDFTIIADQPIRYKGDGSAPGPFDYFLASSVLCAAYFVRLYCNSRDIPTKDIYLRQNNIVDPSNRYQQTFKIEIELPEGISQKDKEGIKRAADRCAVKRVIQNVPDFIIETTEKLGQDNDVADGLYEKTGHTMILGKEFALEQTIKNMTELLKNLGINIEIASWRNPIPHVWSVHIRDADSPMCYTNGKGASKEAALASALGEYIERISNNYFYNDYYLGKEIADSDFVHYPNEKWFSVTEDESIPAGLMDENMLEVYGNDGELKASHLYDTNSGHKEKGICALPFIRQSDNKTIYVPANIVGNLYVSNGMSAGNTKDEARVQCLSEIFERAVKNKIITEEITLPDVPREVLERYPNIIEGINKLEDEGFPIYVKDASLGGKYPVMSVTLMNPRTGGVFASFGAHPKFEVALERTLTELLQGRSFEGLNDVPAPTFNEFAVCEHNNIIDHFIDSTGVISWKYFSSESEYEFVDWDFSGNTHEEFNYLMSIFNEIGKEVYIADYDHLGANACRIIVPGYSEIYMPEDLIWDNNNRALEFREMILNIHRLTDAGLEELIDKLEESEIDNYMPISELIGIAFDENSVWGQLSIGEVKCLSYLALKNYEAAKEFVEMFVTFNDYSVERRRFYQVMNTMLDIELDDRYEYGQYQDALCRMYGESLVNEVRDSLEGKIRFNGLTQTDMNLKGLEKHQKLIESYIKLRTLN